MNGWKTVKLCEVATIDRSSIQPEQIENGTAYIGLEHIGSGGSFVGIEHVDAGVLASTKFQFTELHVLYGKLRPYLAKIACPEFSGICSTDILPILPGPKIERRYLLHFLRQPSMVDYANSRAVGINLPRLSPSVLEEFRIPLPPMEEQIKIAEILDRAEALRAKRRVAIVQLDELTQSIYLDMFGDAVSNPMGWQRYPLKHCINHVQIGPFGSLLHKEDYVFGGIPLINPMHIGNGKIIPDLHQSVTAQKHAELQLYQLRQGDVIMGRRGEMGRCAIVESEYNGMLCGTGSLFIRPDESKAIATYLQATLSSASMRKHLEGLSLGVTLQNLNRGIVEELAISLPPIELQREFAHRIAAIEKLKALHKASLAELDELFVSLQYRAFRGEL